MSSNSSVEPISNNWYESESESQSGDDCAKEMASYTIEELKKSSRTLSGNTTESESRCFESPSSPQKTLDSPKTTLSDFQVVKLLGEGGYGKVFLVQRKNEPGKVYAMKVLRKADLWDAKRIRAVKTEREVLTSMKHPNIVKLKYAFQSSSKFYFIMEYCRGGELFFNLQSGRFGERKTRFYAANVTLALEHFHEHHVLYRDLKPENVLIGDDGYARLTDFGLSKFMGECSKTKSFCGTPEYIAPETIAGEEYSYAVDWWAFGIFLYELVTGTPPFLNENRQVLYNSIRNDAPMIPGYLHTDLQDLLTKLLEKNPLERIRDAETVKRHPWFKSIDWEGMLLKKLTPPFVPFSSSTCDTRNFETTFTEAQIEEQCLTNTVNEKESRMWKNFDYAEEDY